MATMYPTYVGPRTMDQIKARSDWQLLDGEFARRAEALMVAFNGALGYGGGGRTYAQQRALFLQRHHPDPNGNIYFEGRWWALNAGASSAAVPGNSYHEETTPEGKAVAVDFVGDLRILAMHGREYGIREFSQVNNEPWHGQPVEVPNSKRDYNCDVHKLIQWPYPGVPQEDDMADLLRQFRVDRDAAVLLVDGLRATWVHDIVPGENVSAALERYKVSGPVEIVPRSIYHALELVGPAPDYAGVDMNVYPDMTHPSDFAKHTS